MPEVSSTRDMKNAIQDPSQATDQNVDDEIALDSHNSSGSSKTAAIGLKRQPTIYPHGLNISVQTIHDPHATTTTTHQHHEHDSEEFKRYPNYSRACTLQSDSSLRKMENSDQNCHRKYRICMIGNPNPEDLAELQVRRYKYPLTGNYYLDQQDQMTTGSTTTGTTGKTGTKTMSTKLPWMYDYYDYAKRYFRWKYMRWPIIFLASVLLFFGIITYCIWLHDVSVQRQQRYLQHRRFQYDLNDDHLQLEDDDDDGGGGARNDSINNVIHGRTSEENATTLDGGVQVFDGISTTTQRNRDLVSKESQTTLLRAIGSRERPKEQTLTTKDYVDTSKSTIEWIKKDQDRFNSFKKSTTTTTHHTESHPSVVSIDEDDDDGDGDRSLERRVHFTSGHQNSFGVPLEEEQSILRVVNSINSPKPRPATAITPLTKVSPTIPPPVTHTHPTTPMSQPDNRCYSTSLPMCRGVLDYDLTYNSTILLDQAEKFAYEELIHTNCSVRAVEFLCALVEPECRPLHIGVLPPCRRICKAILEACSIAIANSDILSSVFDCNVYPDSSDPHRCEDPTRRSDYCYDNEFVCYDNTCIPQQWQCDNIKDCATGEDEDECLQCDPDEFRCRSNDKCIPETMRCDLKYDCFDGSDEDDCDEYGSGGHDGDGDDDDDRSAAAFDEAALNSFPRVFSYASYLSPNQSEEGGQYTYITASDADEETGTKFQLNTELTMNRTSGVSKEDVTNNVPGTEGGTKGFVNFRDSKEIMMTSDSENKFKYSAIRSNRTGTGSSRYSTTVTTPKATTLQPAAIRTTTTTTTMKPLVKFATTCAPHHLRCVSGKCITVAQLCDKKIDCPDGADELMCVYKEATTKRSNNPSPTPPVNQIKSDLLAAAVVMPTSDSARYDVNGRTLRTTLKRKLKV